MKGFKPTGYGPSPGFKFPAKMGFTGSTGAYTNVQPYVRRKAFADGGFVRQDMPRMKVDSIGDQGSGMVRRAKSYCNVDQESGGKSPLRPGYKKGGMAKKAKSPNPMMKKGMKPMGEFPSKPMKKASGGAIMLRAGHGPLGQMMREKKAAQPAPRKMPPISAIKSKFMADGGKVPRRSNAYSMGDSFAAIGPLVKESITNAADKVVRAMSKGERTVEGRNQSIDEYVGGAGAGRRDGMLSRYSRGGKTRMTKC
jgi:hypothetical protein